ncbi:MAG: hypothetical protein JW881_15160 [Spirochaetales bacterium]|nr:hypothetical protein [Spirochaetales bacterium]
MGKTIISVSITVVCFLCLAESGYTGEGLDFEKIERLPAGITGCVVSNEEGDVVGKAEYDGGGRLVRAVEYGVSERNLVSGVENTYDEKGRLIEKVYLENDIPVQRSTYEYKGDSVAESKTYSCNNNVYILIVSSTYRYDRNKRFVEQRIIDTDGCLTGVFTINRSEDGKLQTEKNFDGEENLIAEYICRYDNYGHVVAYEEKDYEYGYSISVLFEYRYDETGKIVREIQYDSDGDETPIYVFYYAYTYANGDTID